MSEDAKKSDIVDIDGTMKRQTEKAWLIDFGDKEVWIPKSQIEVDLVDDVVTMPEWLAKDKGFI